jgi:hypothetical protein
MTEKPGSEVSFVTCLVLEKSLRHLSFKLLISMIGNKNSYFGKILYKPNNL